MRSPPTLTERARRILPSRTRAYQYRIHITPFGGKAHMHLYYRLSLTEWTDVQTQLLLSARTVSEAADPRAGVRHGETV